MVTIVSKTDVSVPVVSISSSASPSPTSSSNNTDSSMITIEPCVADVNESLFIV